MEGLIKFGLICTTIVGIIFFMGKFPTVAVAVTAITIVLLFLLFKDNY